MNPNLTVRLHTSSRDIPVTRQVQDLTFRKVVPGGYASCSISLLRPLNVTPDELQYFGHLYVFDGRNGNTVWEGRIENLGRGADSSGQVWSIDAVGPMAHAQDVNLPVVYQDQDVSNWRPAADAPTWLDLQQIDTNAYGPGLQIHVPRGTVIPSPPGGFQGWTAWEYVGMWFPGGNAAATVDFVSGEDTTDSNWSWAAADGVYHSFVAGSSVTRHLTFVSPPFFLPMYLKRSSTGVTVADDLTAVSFVAISVRGVLYDRATGAATTDATVYTTPLTSTMVIGDVLGRMLPGYDGVNAAIDTATTYTYLEQLAYADGTTAEDILNDVMTLLPSYYWAAWETTQAGKSRFEWKPWPTTVRYDATAKDGFNSPGSASGVYDSVIVTWTDSAGRARGRQSTTTNAVLTAAGLHRSARIPLTANGGDTAAETAGANFLEQNAVPPSSGTLTISRPIYDRMFGHMVQPWEIQPGTLVRVSDVAPVVVSADSDRDGSTTFRVVSVDYQQASNTATLELDAPALTLTNQIARVIRGTRNLAG